MVAHKSQSALLLATPSGASYRHTGADAGFQEGGKTTVCAHAKTLNSSLFKYSMWLLTISSPGPSMHANEMSLWCETQLVIDS